MKAVAPWVRTRLRTAPGPTAALMLLVLVTSFLAAAFPRAVDTYESRGLRHEVRVAPPKQSVIELTDQPLNDLDADPNEQIDALRPRNLNERYRKILDRLPAALRADSAQSTFGVRIPDPAEASDTWLPALDGGSPVFTLSAPAGLAAHSTLKSGRLPTAAAGSVGPDTNEVQAAVTSATAKVLHIKVGSTIHVPREGTPDPLTVKITGIVEPVHPTKSYWAVEPVLRAPVQLHTPGQPPMPYWHGALLLPSGAAPVLLSVMSQTEVYWRIAPDPSGLGVTDVPRIKSAIASFENGPLQARLRSAVSPGLETDTSLDNTLVEFDDVVSAIRPVVAVGSFGVGSVAGVVLLMAGGLAAARRHTELSLLRSRGGSLAGIAGRLLAETAVPVLPAAAVGCFLAFVATSEGRTLPPLLASAAVAFVACAALPVRAAVLHRRPRLHGEREDLVRARPSRRRIVAEVTVLVLTVAAVAALRRRGVAEGEVDQLLSAAPVLVGIIAALVLVRLYPLPLRLAALPVARRRGAIGFLSLARAGRSPSAAALPLLALLLALTTAAFGGSVLAGIDDARDRASLTAVGADARIGSADPLPDKLTDQVRALPRVDDVAPLHRDFTLDLGDASTETVTLLAVDPASYARLARSTGLGAFRAEDLRRSSGALPALASPGVAERLGGREARVGPGTGQFDVRVRSVRDTTPGLADGGEFLVVDAAGVPHSSPNTLLISGPSVSVDALRTAAGKAGVPVSVTTRAAERAGFVASPVQSGAERIYALAVVAGAGYALLALLLSLLQAGPQQTTLLGRLRTMGLTGRQGRRLLVLENLPRTLLAASGGALVGWAAIRLMAPGIQLDRLALSAPGRFASLGPVQLRADLLSLLLPALAVVVIASAVATVQAWVTTRRTTTTELRAGDTR
ncbi:ABC transporter permease [Streptomyces sp. NBC_01304]|uniref:ABC transporter permease n=1 Tax=Streptomyces sp. NBC_01304 TaxID=2903818 RepID=UPI002E101358|nr:ABC transporter permease [Streptomyces sp. NBC_01304]